MQKGFIQIYTGDGKGKSTAAMGLIVRALGNDFKIFFGQFMKNKTYSEIKTLKSLSKEQLRLEQFGTDRKVGDPVKEKDSEAALSGIELVQSEMLTGEYDLIILDEFNLAAHYGLITEERVLEFLMKKPKHTELVFTGRNAPDWLIDRADLVTEMKMVKHYFKQGVQARKGIEF